jgi:alpha-N-arabinofuranosidase
MTDASDRITSVWQKARVWFLFVVAMAGAAAPTAIGQSVVLSVDARRVLRDGANTFIGINLNYIRDADANRPHARALSAALKDLGVQWLRYPGGEKSDFYLWSTLPYDKPSPVSLGPYQAIRGTRLDFDQYIAEARAIGAEPYVVAGYDSMARTGRTKAQWIESAVAWVRYANVVKKYRVKYWEIGNENWYNGTAEPADMAEIVAEFSSAMKAVDPTIQVGASGNDDAWWSVFLPVAAPHLDFISLSLYNTWAWKGYDRFTRQPPPDLIRNVRKALAAIDRYAPEADRSRLKVVVSETNSKDYSKYGWPATNTLGHALVTFDTLGRLLQQERVLAAMVWTTRWMRDAEARRSQWYALGPNNALLPTGQAVALWGQFLRSKLIAVNGGNDLVSAYASRSADGAALVVWIINRGYNWAGNISLAIKSPVRYRKAVIYRLFGTGPDDTHPRWKRLRVTQISGNAIQRFSCPGVSVTVILLRPKGRASSDQDDAVRLP